MNSLIKKIRKNQTGATMVEYALIVALIAAAVASTVYLVGQEVNEKFNDVIEAMDSASGTGTN